MNEEITAATAKNRSDARWRLRHGFDNIAGQPSRHPRIEESDKIEYADLYENQFKIRDVFHIRPLI